MAKRFSNKVMEFEIRGNVSKGMYLKIIKRENDFASRADYLRNLIMQDLNCDEYGNERKS